MSQQNGFSRNSRIRKKKDFQSFDEGAHRFVLRHFILLLRPSTQEATRLGITVSRFFGGATERNRLKRKIREFFRKNKQCFSHLDVHFIAKAVRKKVTAEKYESELQNDFIAAIEKAEKIR